MGIQTHIYHIYVSIAPNPDQTIGSFTSYVCILLLWLRRRSLFFHSCNLEHFRYWLHSFISIMGTLSLSQRVAVCRVGVLFRFVQVFCLCFFPCSICEFNWFQLGCHIICVVHIPYWAANEYDHTKSKQTNKHMRALAAPKSSRFK